MGVKDLWQLLEPVGRRINIEALTNKQLAVGAFHVFQFEPSFMRTLLTEVCTQVFSAGP